MTKNKINLGFSLIGSILTISLFVLIIGGLFEFIFGLYKANFYSLQQTEAISEARNGITTMAREIREASTGDDGSYIIEKADDYEFIFYSDINKNGKVERVRYFIDGNDFKKGIIEPTGSPPKYITDPSDPNFNEQIQIISKYVRNKPPIFRYFDGEMNELPAPARLKDTKLMRVYLVINVDPNRKPNDFTLESDIQLRNLKTNL